MNAIRASVMLLGRLGTMQRRQEDALLVILRVAGFRHE
jgi:hypothetical protein